ncbi:MAG: type IVB secretion system protein IcmH/DotU [Betaproteobacteria bacterium]|nr:type IVB secretion system protein IcmH/DotU [Betaproteobacteria bacterium]
MSQHQEENDFEKTVIHLDKSRKTTPLPFAPVTVAQSRQIPRNPQYIAQQSSIEAYTPGLNPLVNAAAKLLTDMILLRDGKIEELETLRTRLEAEVRGFTAQAQALGVSEAQMTAARYVLCTALDESITGSNIPDAGDSWSPRSLLSTFHNETWGGERFFMVLEKTMQQPASNLYILELLYLLLSFGFEGKYRVEDRGSLAVEALREQLYRQIRLLRGEARMDLAGKIPITASKSKIYAYIPAWLVAIVVVFCLSVTFWGFSRLLASKADSLLTQYAKHAPAAAPYIKTEQSESDEESATENASAEDAPAGAASKNSLQEGEQQ